MDNWVTDSWNPSYKKEKQQKAENTSLCNLKWNLTFLREKVAVLFDNRVIVSKLFWLEILCDFQLAELHAYCVKSWDKRDAICYSTTHPKTVTEQILWIQHCLIHKQYNHVEKNKEKNEQSSCSQSPVKRSILSIYYEACRS